MKKALDLYTEVNNNRLWLLEGRITSREAREVFQPCLLANAAACFVFHNHPSGDTTPSREDKAITERLVKAGHILDVPVLDHIIVGDNFYSFRTDGTERRCNIPW